MASTRAPAVAEILWELKRSDKVASFSAIAERAGFSAGANGRAMLTCMKTVRKDWPHLHWWRAIRDDSTVKEGGEQAAELKEWGVEVGSTGEDGRVSVEIDESKMMVWDNDSAEKSESVTPSAKSA